MTKQWMMKALATAVICWFPLTLGSVRSAGQVLRCVARMSSIHDDWLQRSVDELKAKHPNISFQSDDQPCRHANETMAAFTRTLGRSYFKAVSGYEFTKILNADSYFTVERFQFRDASELHRLDAALKNVRSRKLKIEANTRYDYFIADDSIVFMVSSAVGNDENAKLFIQLKQFFSSLTSTSRGEWNK